MIRARHRAIIDDDLEAGVASVPRHARGFLVIEAARAHTYG